MADPAPRLSRLFDAHPPPSAPRRPISAHVEEIMGWVPLLPGGRRNLRASWRLYAGDAPVEFTMELDDMAYTFEAMRLTADGALTGVLLGNEGGEPWDPRERWSWEGARALLARHNGGAEPSCGPAHQFSLSLAPGDPSIGWDLIWALAARYGAVMVGGKDPAGHRGSIGVAQVRGRERVLVVSDNLAFDAKMKGGERRLVWAWGTFARWCDAALGGLPPVGQIEYGSHALIHRAKADTAPDAPAFPAGARPLGDPAWRVALWTITGGEFLGTPGPAVAPADLPAVLAARFGEGAFVEIEGPVPGPGKKRPRLGWVEVAAGGALVHHTAAPALVPPFHPTAVRGTMTPWATWCARWRAANDGREPEFTYARGHLATMPVPPSVSDWTADADPAPAERWHLANTATGFRSAGAAPARTPVDALAARLTQIDAAAEGVARAAAPRPRGRGGA